MQKPLAPLAVTLLALVLPAAAQVTQDAYLKASNTDPSDWFGTAVAISGDTVVVSALREDGASSGVDGDPADNSAQDAGAVYVFVRDGSGWVQQAYLKASNAAPKDNFGSAVAIDGDTLVVGAKQEDSGSPGVDADQSDDSVERAGAVYVFVRNGTVWSQQAYIKSTDPDPLDDFGFSVAVAGDTLVVGTPFEDSGASGVDGDATDNSLNASGAAWVFERTGNLWSQTAYLKAFNPDAFDFFGRAVAVDGDTIVVTASLEESGAPGVDGDPNDNSVDDAGAAYVFERDGESWSQTSYIKSSNPGIMDAFGRSVALDGDTLLIGASGESSGATGVDGDQLDDSVERAGAAYVFERSGATWVQRAYLKPSNPTATGAFGSSVGLEGDLALVCAPRDWSSATGIWGDDSDAGANHSGAAYAFIRQGATWTTGAYIKPSNTGANDHAGEVMALADGLALIGSVYEDSAATGIDGDGMNEDAVDSGAAYLFELCELVPSVETPRLGSPPNPDALRPGATLGPILGATWDPGIDHTSFQPDAVGDFLAIALTASNLPTPQGTILCGLDPILVVSAAAGELFELPLPPVCATVGVTLCAQGASVNALLELAFTNALDITIGSY